MAKITTYILLFSFMAIYDAVEVGPQKKRSVHPSGETLVKNTEKWVGKLLGMATSFALNQVKSSCTVALTNKMSTWDLVHPRLYLKEGVTFTPPPFRLPKAADHATAATQTMLMEGNPIGVLCYDFQILNNIKLVCLYFNLVKQTFGIKDMGPSSNFESESSFKTILKDFHKNDVYYANKIGKFVREDPNAEMTIFAQMTTSEKTQLSLEFYESPVNDFVYKRDLTAFAVVGSVLATAAYKYITSEQGTILTLENESTNDIVLEDTMWCLKGVEVVDIIPRKLGPEQSSEITVLAPFAKTQGSIIDRFKKSVFVLSFQVKKFKERRIVIAIWWPRKAGYGGLNSYLITSIDLEEPKVAKSLEDLAVAIQQKPRSDTTVKFEYKNKEKKLPFVQVEKYQHYTTWSMKLQTDTGQNEVLKVITGMGNARKNSLVVKISDPGQLQEDPSSNTPVIAIPFEA